MSWEWPVGTGPATANELEITEQLHRELTLARELALAVGAAETVDAAMELTLREFCQATGWAIGEAWLSDGEDLVLSSVWHEASTRLEGFDASMVGTRVPKSLGIPGHALESKTPVWMRNVASDPRFLRASLAKRYGIGAGMAVPVLSGELVVAVLVFFVAEPREEDEHLIDLVSAVSAQIGSLVMRKQAEEAGRQSEEQLRAIADTAVDAIVSADSKGRITYFNRAAEQIFGHASPDVIGEPLKMLMPERFHAAHDHGFERFLATGESHVIGQRVELAGLRGDGTEFPLELALSSWRAGDAVYFTALLRDVTDRRAAEQVLRQSDMMKTALLRSVSHDLRSPLTAIVAAGESSASPSIGEESRRELASVIVKEATRLSRLVDKLLDLSRLQGGAAAPKKMSCSIEEILQAALYQTDGHGKGFEIEIDPDLPGVLADAAQLERAFANLLENASRFSGGHPVRVKVDQEVERLLVCIVDRGPGLAPDKLDEIFEPFYRAPELEATHQGSGLGLAIVKGFIEANGGRVWAESDGLGAGTTFSVELPLEPASGDSVTTEGAPTTA